MEIRLGGKVYQSDTTISYDLYKKYYHTKKGLKVIWKPEDYLFNSKIKDISDNFRIEVNYKSNASKLFEVELSFNQKGQMFVQKRKAKRTEINTELKQSKHKYLRFSTLSESETIKELEELLPQEVIDELMKNGYVYEDKKENYFNFSNDKDEPTLRLDVSYDKNNKIIQYVSKEYGFTDSITSTLEKDPIEIIKHAQDILMNQQLPLTKVILPSHYSGGNYKAYIDDSYQKADAILNFIRQRPIDLKSLSMQVDAARDVIYKLYDNVHNLIVTAEMVEDAIIFGNRYRSSFLEVNTELTKAELLYRNGEYTKALSTAVDIIEKIKPDSYEMLVNKKSPKNA